MTDEQRKRIHDITYSTDDRMELAERIVRLEDERNHWHVEQTHAYSNWEDACKRAKELESENARLRELENIRMSQVRHCEGLDRENAKLRVERDEWHRVAVSKQDIIDHMRDARAENAKLRELVRKMYRATLFSCSECWISRTFNPAECDNENCDNRKDYLTMRELGIEVEDA